jgi:putative ABC transport system permease protein
MSMLALAIGANVAVFTVISRTLLKPLHCRNASELVTLYTMHEEANGTPTTYNITSVDFVQWRLRARLFSAIEVARHAVMTLGGGSIPESIDGALVSGSHLRTMGVSPILGRDFAPSEDVANARVAIISHGLWQRRFGGARDVIGRTLIVDGNLAEIIGVLPDDFEIPQVKADILMPVGLGPSRMPEPNLAIYQGLGRLRKGVTIKQAAAELHGIARQVQRDFPDSHKGWDAGVNSIRNAQFNNSRGALLVLWASVLFVHLLACVNVANLLLARSAEESGVTALRLILGAQRWQLMRGRLYEAVMISVGGTLAGLAGGLGALRLILARVSDPTLSTRVENPWTLPLFLVALAVVTALVTAIVPALRESRSDLSAILNEGSLRASSSVRGTRAREAFIVAEIALAVPLLLAAAATVKRFSDLQTLNIGFDPGHVLTAQIQLPPRYDTKPKRAAFADDVLGRIEHIPGVTSAGLTTNTFQLGDSPGTVAWTDEKPEPLTMAFRRVSASYFGTMHIALQRGRVFDRHDVIGAPPVAIVSESLARIFWPTRDAVGQRLFRGSPPTAFTVVGIAHDVRDNGPGVDIGPALYVPYAQNNNVYISLVVRTSIDPTAVIAPLRMSVAAADRDLAPAAVVPLGVLVTGAMSGERLQLALLSSFAVIALLLAAVGIFGVTTYAVSRRMREIGVRLAFGASPANVVFELLRRSARSVAIGLALGLGLAVVASRVATFVSYGAARLNPGYAVGVVAVLFAASILATLVPALKAQSANPTALLRDA